MQAEAALLAPVEPALDPAHSPAIAVSPDDWATLSAALALAPTLTAALPPPAALLPTLQALVPVLAQLLGTANDERVRLVDRQRLLQAHQQELEQTLRHLVNGQRRYPVAVEQLRDRLTGIVGERPRLLCELLEIPNERWQDAVEAQLGGRRFNIVVPPSRFSAALAELDRARAEERIDDVGIIDLEKVAREGRRAQPNSLAEQVTTRSERLQPYLNTILGDIICCETVAELRQHRRAVTPTVVTYSEWTVRSIRPSKYQPWMIGSRAVASQIAAANEQLAEVRAELERLAPAAQSLAALIAGLDRIRALDRVIHELENYPLDRAALDAEIASATAELAALDLSGVAALEQEAARLRQLQAAEQRRRDELNRLVGRLQGEAERRRAQRAIIQREQAERQAVVVAEEARFPQALAAVASLVAEREAADLGEAIRNTEVAQKGFDSRATNELQRLGMDGKTYNVRYQFAAIPDNPDEERYAIELQRLRETDLPQYLASIQQTEQESEEELREHVLHRLREQILLAKEQLNRINDALGQLTFHSERYRFKYQPPEDHLDFYELITDSQLLGAGSLFQSEFYERHKATFDQFYAALTRVPQSDAEVAEQRRLTDYRRYLSYDIEVTHPNGQVSRLSKIMGQTSGGETQTPFYVTIAASFVQLYRINERSGRPTVRLVAFDEAFSKMDQDRIGATLELFQHFGLQIITATPLERCEYIVPKMCTNLVLLGVGDTVLIEPYRNYAARLAQFTTEDQDAG